MITTLSWEAGLKAAQADLALQERFVRRDQDPARPGYWIYADEMQGTWARRTNYSGYLGEWFRSPEDRSKREASLEFELELAKAAIKSPKPGTLLQVSVIRLSRRPPIAKLWPLSSSISVCTRRVEMAGMWKPWNVRPLAKSSELTSGATCNRIVPRGVILGTKFKRMPNSLN